MQMDPETFERMRLSEMLEHCAECGFASKFTKADYHFLTPPER